MEPFATPDDLQDRWRTLDKAEETRATVLLGDASALVAGELVRAGVVVDPSDEVQAANLRSVCCSMVRRSMDVPDGMAGVSQCSQTAGPYSGSASFANPHADLYMTSSERRRLGLKRMRAGSLRPTIGGADDTW